MFAVFLAAFQIHCLYIRVTSPADGVVMIIAAVGFLDFGYNFGHNSGHDQRPILPIKLTLVPVG